MAESYPSTVAPKNSSRRQALMWLMMALLLGIVTALVWMFSQTSAIGAQIENAPIATPQATVDELKQPLSIESLHELDTDVQPIDFAATVRDLRNYPDEFKDKRYLSANKGKWTVQVMNVAENEVIVSYLEGRDDREKFAYFRYLDENKQMRYMLTYGIMSSPQEAVGAAKLIDFNLPADVRVLPEEINRYVSIIDNYERPEPIKDLGNQRARSVKLRRTQREVPVRRKAPIADNSTTTDSNNISADAIKERAERNMANDDSGSGANNEESIRQSEDTSATLSVNEARSFESEGDNTPQKTESPRKNEAEVKKPPAVAAPKPPAANPPKAPAAGASSTSSANNASSSSKANAAKANSDTMKELIEDKSN